MTRETSAMSPPAPVRGGRRGGALLPPAPSGFNSRTAPSVFRPPCSHTRRSASRRDTSSGHPGFESRRWADAHREPRLEDRRPSRPNPRRRFSDRPTVRSTATVEQERYFACLAGFPGSIPGALRGNRSTRSAEDKGRRARAPRPPWVGTRPPYRSGDFPVAVRPRVQSGRHNTPALEPGVAGSISGRRDASPDPREAEGFAQPCRRHRPLAEPASGDPTLRGRPLRLR